MNRAESEIQHCSKIQACTVQQTQQSWENFQQRMSEESSEYGEGTNT